MLVVTNSLPAKDVKSLIALLKAEPGKHNYASAGGGSTFHMAAELFKANADVPLVHIPYRGGGPALVDTIGGQVSLSFPVLSAALPQVQGGKLRALGVTGSKRSPLLPNVPTLAEAGLPNYNFETWFMVFAPAATPKAVIDRLNSSLNEALGSPAIAERMARKASIRFHRRPNRRAPGLRKSCRNGRNSSRRAASRRTDGRTAARQSAEGPIAWSWRRTVSAPSWPLRRSPGQ